MAGETSSALNRGGAGSAKAAPAAGWSVHGPVCAALAALAAALVWGTGFRGFMPLDQSIVWDGAWRLLSGQAPFADFLIPNGLVPAAIQAALFRLFGISWTVYVAHAALANVALALLVYATLARLFGRAAPAAAYAASTAAMFYPPMGTPYMDQHAVLFSALLFIMLLWDTGTQRASARLYFLLPVVAALGYLSKQTPTVWAVVWVGWMLVVRARRADRGSGRALAALAAGVAAAVFGLVLALAASGATPDQAWLSLVNLPGEVGRQRLDWAWIGPRLHDLAKPGLLVVAATLAWRAAPLLRPGVGREATVAWTMHAAATGIVAMSGLYALTTDNSAWFGLGALPLAAGLAHALVERRGSADGPLRRHVGWLVAIGIMLQAAVMYLDTGLTRAANELRRFDWATAIPGGAVDARLAGLAWGLPPGAPGESHADSYAALLRHLRAEPGGFVLIGDATILYALAGKPSAFPALWFHPGLAYPPPGHPARPQFEAMIAIAMKRHDVRRIVVDDAHTWAGARAEGFAPIVACLARAQGTVAFGRFRVVAVPSGCAQG